MNNGRRRSRWLCQPPSLLRSFPSGARRRSSQRLARRAYYVAHRRQAIGKAAPWFILSIMLFSYAVRAIYIESCSDVRGAAGLYKWCTEALGGTLARILRLGC